MITQIYEIQTPEEAQHLIELGVDHIGSVVISQSQWQNPTLLESIRIIADSDAKSSLIPLFSDPDAVCRVIAYYQPDIVHFCEMISEDAKPDHLKPLIQLQQQVKRQFPRITIMRSIPIVVSGSESEFPSLKIARYLEPVSDIFLTDTLIPGTHGPEAADQPVAGFVGITGKTCDWDIASTLVAQSGIPVILAGGLTPDNVARAIERVNPAGVDSCTGTNAVNDDGVPIRFKKDLQKVRRFVRIAKQFSAP